jgi:hypothetical protein
MSRIRSVDIMVVDELFQASPGYVLDFSDRTFTAFFARELDVDIDDPIYARNGTSKANRLRSFLSIVDDQTAIQTLRALWEYRCAMRERQGNNEETPNAEGQLLRLIARLEGNANAGSSGLPPAPVFNRATNVRFRDELKALWDLDPHPRGYAFEAYLKALFDTFGMRAREPFRLTGEQIDGSFQLGTDTYLLEAKWHRQKIGVDELDSFQSRVDRKAAWARGLFVSYTGFTDEGLFAFGTGKKVICMEGRDIYEALDRDIPINDLLSRKVRWAAETGAAFTSIDRLFPR